VSNNDQQYAWDNLQNIRFEGEIRKPSATPNSFGSPVVEVTDRSVVIDLLIQPLKALQGMVANASTTWMRLRAKGITDEQIFHKHKGSEPFWVWLDVQVGRACGFPKLGTNDFRSEHVGPNFRYRAITISNFRRCNTMNHNAIRELSTFQARSTWDQIQNFGERNR